MQRFLRNKEACRVSSSWHYIHVNMIWELIEELVKLVQILLDLLVLCVIKLLLLCIQAYIALYAISSDYKSCDFVLQSGRAVLNELSAAKKVEKRKQLGLVLQLARNLQPRSECNECSWLSKGNVIAKNFRIIARCRKHLLDMIYVRKSKGTGGLGWQIEKYHLLDDEVVFYGYQTKYSYHKPTDELILRNLLLLEEKI